MRASGFKVIVTSAAVWSIAAASGAGCKKSEPSAPASVAPPASQAAVEAASTGDADARANATPAAETKAAEPGGAEQAAGEPDTGGKSAAEGAKLDELPPPGLSPEAEKVDAYLRDFFAKLEAGELDSAKAFGLTEPECTEIWTDAAACKDIVKGWTEGMAELERDPVPKGSTIGQIFAGERQAIGQDKGLKKETGVWVGHVIFGTTPTGHQFTLKSLGVIETEKGLRLLWGKRRSGPDTPRTPPPSAIAPPEGASPEGTTPPTPPTGGSTPEAPAAAAQPPAEGAPPPADAPKPAEVVPAGGAASPPDGP